METQEPFGFANWSNVFGLKILGRICFPFYCFPSVALFNLSNLNKYTMMQCKAKSENLAHILGRQTGAVTILPPLQESRPEILE